MRGRERTMVMSQAGSRLRYESAPARRQRILDVLKEIGFSNVSDLATLLGVSEMTIRRDFRHLANLGLIRQVHGGVSAISSSEGPIDFRLRAAENQDVKCAIAARAASCLVAGSVIGLDAGTTTLQLARDIPEGTAITVVTHSLPAMSALAGRSSISLIGLGGQLHPETQSFAGPMTVRMIADLRLGLTLLAATSVQAGSMWCTNTFDAEIKQALIRASDRVVLLADSSKFRSSAVMRVAAVTTLTTVITDSGTDDQAVRELQGAGVTVDVVDVTSGPD